MSLTEKQLDFLEEKLSELQIDIDLPYYANEDTTDFDSLRDEIDNQGGFDVEIIYYGRAMEYLMEHDTSLNESLEIADELGYDLKSLNSETLASLLASRNARIEFDDLESEIDGIFEEVDELGEDEDEEEEEEETETV